LTLQILLFGENNKENFILHHSCASLHCTKFYAYCPNAPYFFASVHVRLLYVEFDIISFDSMDSMHTRQMKVVKYGRKICICFGSVWRNFSI